MHYSREKHKRNQAGFYLKLCSHIIIGHQLFLEKRIGEKAHNFSKRSTCKIFKYISEYTHRDEIHFLNKER